MRWVLLLLWLSWLLGAVTTDPPGVRAIDGNPCLSVFVGVYDAEESGEQQNETDACAANCAFN